MGICLAVYSSSLSLKTPLWGKKNFFYAQESRNERKTSYKVFLFSKLFDKHHRSRIGILSTNKIKTNGKYNRGTVNQDVPVHRR